MSWRLVCDRNTVDLRPHSVPLELTCMNRIIFFWLDTAPTEIYTLSLHDALPIWPRRYGGGDLEPLWESCDIFPAIWARSEEHTSELQSRLHLVCRLLLEKKNKLQSPRDLVGLITTSRPRHNANEDGDIPYTQRSS